MPKKQLNSRLESLFSSLNQREATLSPESAQSPPGWTWECNAAGQYVNCSPEIAQVLGYSPEEILGQPLQSFGLASQSIVDLCDVLATGPYPAQVELYFKSRPGLLIPIRMHLFIRTDPDGTPAGWRGFTQLLPGLPLPQETSQPPSLPIEASPVQPVAPSIKAGYAVAESGRIEPAAAPWTRLGAQAFPQDTPHHGSILEPDGALAIPFSTGATSHGIIEIFGSGEKPWTKDERLLVQEVASQLALALENAQLYAAVQQELAERVRAEQETLRRNRDLAILNRIGQQLNRLASPSEIFELVFTGIGQVMDNRNLFIALYDAEDQHISFPIYSVDGQTQIVAGHPFGDGLIEHVIQTREPLLLKKQVKQGLAVRGIKSFGRIAASLLAVPMLTADKVVGVIAAQDFEKENSFSDIQSELLSTIASQATIALENANLFQQMQGALITIEIRERYQKNVARAVAALTEFGTQALPDVLKMLGEAAQASRVYYIAAVPGDLPAPFSGLVWQIVAEWCDDNAPSIASALTSFNNLPSSKLPFLANELKDQGKFSGFTSIMPSQESEFLQALNIRSFLAIAVPGKTPIPGFIGFDEIDYERPWGTEEIDALQMASASLSNTIAREDLLDQLQASLDETENLYNASRRLAMASTYQELVTAITEGLRIPSINRGVLILFESDLDNQVTSMEVVANWHSGWGILPTRLGTHYGPELLTACPRLVNTSPLFFDDMHEDDELVWTYPDIFDRDHTAGLAIMPLGVGKRQLGVFLLQSEVPYHFSEREIRSYPPLLGQMAIAIENLRLFRETQEALAETRALYDASQPLSSPEELGALLQALTEAVARTLPAHQVHLEIFDLTARQITYQVHSGRDEPSTQGGDGQSAGISFEEMEASLTGWVLRERKYALSPKGMDDLREGPAAKSHRQAQTIGAILVAPLLYQERVLGAITASNLLDEPDFSPRDVNFINAIANQAAIAVANAQLFEQTQKALAETEALYQASAELNLAHSYEEILNTLQKHTLLGENAQDISLCFYEHSMPASYEALNQDLTALQNNENQAAIQVVARITQLPASTFDQTYLLRVFPSVIRILTSASPTIIPDVSQATEYDENARRLFSERFGARSTIFLPMVIGGQWIGFINAIYQQPQEFPEEKVRRLVSLANQAAVAVQNLRSIGVAEKRADEAMLQFQTAQRLSQAKDEAELFRLTLGACHSGVNLTSSHILLLPAGPGITPDASSPQRGFDQPASNDGYLEQAAHFSEPGLPHTEDGLRYPVVFYPFIDLLLSGVPASSSNIASDPRLTLSTRQWFIQNGLAAALLLPLQVHGQPAGLLVVGRNTPEPFLSSETTFLQTITTQLSFALDNLRLLQETRQLLLDSRRRALELQTAAEIARDTSSTLALDTLLQRVVTMISERFGLYQVSIFLNDDENMYAVIRESTGTAGEEMKRRGHKLLINPVNADVAPSIVGTAVRTSQPVIVNDVSASPIHRPNPLLPDTRAELGIPLKIGERVIGALDVQSRQTGIFNSANVAVFQTLSDQIAVAIDNARSYELAQKAILEMREVDRLKSQFLANMSHELRTPLNSIIGFSRVILKGIDGSINDTQQADLLAIYNSGQHLLKLINDILDLSKIDAGKMDLTFEDVNLIDLINSVMATAVGLVKDKPIKLLRNFPTEIPNVRADTTKIRQVVLNLLSNAAKFTEEGSITVELGSGLGPEGKPEAYVRVIDTGLGIALKDQIKLFQPFSQVDGSPTRKTGGTGLGLSICKSLVELHGGRIGLLRSEIRKGSTFFFTLPIPGPDNGGRKEDKRDAYGSSSPHYSILIIDDDQQVIDLYERFLTPEGYSINPVTETTYVVEQARQLKPFAITLDIMMPNRDGWQILQDLKKDPATRDIPVIICSILEEGEKGASLGAADYLVKPFLPEDLIKALDRLKSSASTQEIQIDKDTRADRTSNPN